MQWWGYSKEHGWVVLDRSIASNAPGIKADLLFVRCRDTVVVRVERESWVPPAYRFAPNYIKALTPAAAEEATAELEALKLRWPEFEREIQRDVRETEERAEAARVREETERKRLASEMRKLAASEKKKQDAAAAA